MLRKGKPKCGVEKSNSISNMGKHGSWEATLGGRRIEYLWSGWDDQTICGAATAVEQSSVVPHHSYREQFEMKL